MTELLQKAQKYMNGEGAIVTKEERRKELMKLHSPTGYGV